MAIFFEQNLPFGLDISDFKLRIVQLKKRGKNIKLANFSEVTVPPGVITDGNIQQAEKFTALLNKLKEGIAHIHLAKNIKVIVGLPEKQSFIKVSLLEKNEPENIIKEISKHVPYQLSEMYYDYKIIQNIFNNSSGLYFAACRKTIVEKYLNILQSVNFEVEVFELETEAISRCLFLPTDKFAYLIIDIGLARSTIFITFQGYVFFSISFPSIIYDRKAYISELINHIAKIFDFYDEHLKNYFSLNAIVTCGTGAHIINLNEEIQKKFNIKTLAGNPWQNIKNLNLNSIKKISYPNSYATAIGLALRPVLNRNYI